MEAPSAMEAPSPAFFFPWHPLSSGTLTGSSAAKNSTKHTQKHFSDALVPRQTSGACWGLGPLVMLKGIAKGCEKLLERGM